VALFTSVPLLALGLVAACGSFSGNDTASGADGGGTVEGSAGALDAQQAPTDGGGGSLDVNDGSVDARVGTPACEWNAPFTAAHLLDELTTAAGEGTARLSQDELAVYFWRNNGAALADIFLATRGATTGPFGTPSPLVGVVNTTSYEQDPFLSEDGLTLYFASDRSRAGSSVLQLFVTTRGNRAVSFTDTPGPLTVHSPSSANEYGPYVGAISGDLWYTRNDPGGTSDIYRAPSAGVSGFGNPAPVMELNTAAQNESYPVLSSDELTVWFESEPGGAATIFVAHRASTKLPFDAPTKVQELVSMFDGGGGTMRPSFVSKDQCRLYAFGFTGQPAGERIYVAERTPK
jgi:hypothetical protein